ncbi:hypothetical protein [Encephalitozoon cuniculi GB-M1]|uniref:Uncharacterized protein n=1 Tax=Encephalitozoon cuniculi (strain GB-M1) TaxID=284813 RepID=Q8SUR1_ENCCU|nr:uncharacterized protein ECU08_0750 [Encephalitozoon cuniculi GB-M1]CAD26380.2 hypothetical protein [Encephalitozoon cuniculi GB-M1]
MDEIFVGNPSKREIEMHLRNKKHSLLNNAGLRGDILSKRVEEESGGDGTDPEFVKSRIYSDSPGYPTRDGLSRKKASVGHKMESRREALIEKDSNVKAEMKWEGSRSRVASKRTVERNTIKNSGYRHVILVFDGSCGHLGTGGRRHRRKVRFNTHSTVGKPHNTGEPSSILLPSSKPRKLPRTRKKEKIFVESLPPDTDSGSGA